MGIITKEVEIRINSFNVEYYKSLGYEIPMKEASKEYKRKKKKDFVYDFSKPIVVRVSDLQKGSHAIVEVLCDYCKECIVSMTYNNYNRSIKAINKFSCNKCKYEKVKEVNLIYFNVDNYTKTKECQEKMKSTMECRYGVKHALQNEKIKNRFKNTCIAKYGNRYGEVFSERAFKTFKERTGYDYPSQSPEVREKIAQSYIDSFGVENPAQSPEIREKITQTLYANSSQKASRQQRYICNLYNGILNYPVKYYNCDIYLPEYNIICEYDGGGHDLNITTGRMTQEEFNQKEIIRNKVIKREGYKQMRIISSKDLLPSDEILLQLLSHAKQYFSEYPNHSWINFDIDNSRLINAENKDSDGVFFDYGKLRRITDNDIKSLQETT